MAQPPYSTGARRAARRARLRRRQARAGALAVVLAAAAVAATVLTTPGSPARAHVRHRRAAIRSSVRPRLSLPRRGGARLAAVEARGIDRIRQLAKLGLPIYCAGPRGNALAFTFDDGPGPYTHFALKKLAQAHERATFFVVGRSMDFFPGWLPRELTVATIGDHTYTHPFLPGLSPTAITSELSRTKAKIEEASGQPVYLFRPPYGARDRTVDTIARRLGLLEIIWSVDSADSLGANWAGIIRNVEAGMRPGAIILMHENRGQTIRALTTLLPALHRRHLRSVSLPELLATDPPSVAQVREGRRACRLRVRARSGA